QASVPSGRSRRSGCSGVTSISSPRRVVMRRVRERPPLYTWLARSPPQRLAIARSIGRYSPGAVPSASEAMGTRPLEVRTSDEPATHLPVPAGPIPKTMSKLRIASMYSFCATLFGVMTRLCAEMKTVSRKMSRSFALRSRARPRRSAAPGAEQLVGSGERLVEPGGILSAGLREVGPPAAPAAHQRRELLDDLAGVVAAGEVLRDPGHQERALLVGRAE